MSPLTVPNWMVRIYSNFDEQSKAVIHRLGPELHFSNKKVNFFKTTDFIMFPIFSPKN